MKMNMHLLCDLTERSLKHDITEQTFGLKTESLTA